MVLGNYFDSVTELKLWIVTEPTKNLTFEQKLRESTGKCTLLSGVIKLIYFSRCNAGKIVYFRHKIRYKLC